MKNFLIFFAVILVIIAAFIWYYMQHPSDTTIVRQGANWVVLERNISQ